MLDKNNWNSRLSRDQIIKGKIKCFNALLRDAHFEIRTVRE